jgi:hypothetical protein
MPCFSFPRKRFRPGSDSIPGRSAPRWSGPWSAVLALLIGSGSLVGVTGAPLTARSGRVLAAAPARSLNRALAGEVYPGLPRLGGPWYTDLQRHWAETPIRVLWEEGVAPPPFSPGGNPLNQAWSRPGPYVPEAGIARQLFLAVLTRLYPGEPFPLPPLASPLPGEPAPDLTRPDTRSGRRPAPGYFTRLDAVETLIIALGLSDFARGLSPEAAATYLGVFADGRDVPPADRPALATAIFLGIINGYPDATLRPSRRLTRAEGAAILYRSCLFLAIARPNPFSPDGDGSEDETVISLGSLINRNSIGWDFFILDARSQVLRCLKPANAVAFPPPSLTWDGRTDAGLRLAPGLYYYRGFVRDRRGLTHWSVRRPIVIEEKALQVFARPAVVLPGQTVTIRAATSGGPSRVTAKLSSFTADGTLTLRPASDPSGVGDPISARTWSAVFRVPAGAEPGPCLVTAVAAYPATTRIGTAQFEVGRLALSGDLLPNPVMAGSALQIRAWPNLAVQSVTAAVTWSDRPLEKALAPCGRELEKPCWRGEVIVPPHTRPGRYMITLTARLAALTATATLELIVGLDRSSMAFILSD